MNKQQKHPKPLKVMAQDAVQVVAGWLWDRLPDRFGPADPILDEEKKVWRVPVVLSYPGVTVGQVGEIVVDAFSSKIVAHTDPAEMRAAGLQLGRKHRAKVRAAFLRTRNA